jgi:ABC-type transport system involved in multi-copper enzyme maturation permease subunit
MSEVTIAKKATGKARLAMGNRLGLILLLVNIAGGVAMTLIWIALPGLLQTAMVVAGFAVVAQLALMSLSPGIRAVARQTLAQCLRMKIAIVFIILLAGALLMVSTKMKGDGTLAGQIRTLLYYGTFLTSLLLSMVTIFLGSSLVSNDVRDKQIFLTASKPLARWQYIIGRWMGLVMLNIVLLTIAAVAIYGVSQHVRTTQTISGKQVEPSDRLAVETEVFSSRAKALPLPTDVEKIVEGRMRQLQEDQPNYQATISRYKLQLRSNSDFDAHQAILDEYRKQALGQLESVQAVPAELADQVPALLEASMQQPLPCSRQWVFAGLKAAGSEVTGTGKVKGPAMQDKTNSTTYIQIQSDPQTIGRLLFTGPLRVDHLKGRVERVLEDTFWVSFLKSEVTQNDIDSLSDGKEVHLVIEPTVQVSFKVTGTYDMAKGVWLAVNPTTGMRYIQLREDPPNIQITLTVPASLVDDSGNLKLYFINRSAGSFSILEADVAVLYRVGQFEWNYLRSILLMLLQLMFLSAMAVVAGSLFSFPVACLVSFSVLPFSMGRDFISQAISQLSLDYPSWAKVVDAITNLMTLILPDLQRTNPGDALVGGMDLSWMFVGETAFVQVAVRTLLALVLACWIFEKRELARVQV